MSLHPIVIRDHIERTTANATFGRKGSRNKSGHVVWSMFLIAWAVLYFGSKLV